MTAFQAETTKPSAGWANCGIKAKTSPCSHLAPIFAGGSQFPVRLCAIRNIQSSGTRLGGFRRWPAAAIGFVSTLAEVSQDHRAEPTKIRMLRFGQEAVPPQPTGAASQPSISAARDQETAYQRVVEQLREERAMLGLNATEQRILSEQRRAGVSAASEQGKAIEAVVRGIEAETERLDRFEAQQREVNDAVRNLAGSALDGVLGVGAGRGDGGRCGTRPRQRNPAGSELRRPAGRGAARRPVRRRRDRWRRQCRRGRAGRTSARRCDAHAGRGRSLGGLSGARRAGRSVQDLCRRRERPGAAAHGRPVGLCRAEQGRVRLGSGTGPST